MTLLQVRIRDASEAATAATSGIDCVELVIGNGADLAVAHDARRAFAGILRLRLDGPQLSAALCGEIAEIAADELAVTDGAFVSSGTDIPDSLTRVALVAPSDGVEVVGRVKGKADALMLDAGGDARLIDVAPIATIDAFASACRSEDLAFGLAGGLEAPDVARLLLLEPDVLAFDTAVRRDHAPQGALDVQALDAIRALIPRQPRASGDRHAIAKVTDRIFVRDFELSLAIGAYQAEHGKRQRVRFGVSAEVVRAAGPPQDMRDVFSYDIMIETIRVMAERPHVTFVETLAEEVAAAILAHAEVVSVTVTVEKLDVINGAVGIEITRRRGA